MLHRIRLEVSDLPDEQQMKDTAASIWGDGNTSWAEFTVYMLLPESFYQERGWAKNAFPYSRTEFTPAGLQSIDINQVAL